MTKTSVSSRKVAHDLARLYRKDGYETVVEKIPKGTYYYNTGKRYYVTIKGL